MRQAMLASLVAMALSGLAAGAQAIQIVPAAMPGCRVGLYAQQRASGQTLWTTALEDVVHPPTQKRGLHVVVTRRTLAIRDITLRVTFLPYGVRAIPTDSLTRRDLSEQTRTFTLHGTDDAALKVTGDLLLGLVSGVKSVAVDKIEFADGSSWTAPENNPCRVAPSGYVPVAATAH